MSLTVADLLANEDLRREEFPVVRDGIFLGHGGVSPLPRRVSDAIANYARQCSGRDQERFVYPGILTEARNLVARLLDCKADEVAFVGPTSLALSYFASGLIFRKGENILIYFDDYPSNVYPWMALAEKGVEVRLMNTRGLGVIRPRDVLGQVDENTRLVALASCHFLSGYRLDYQAIGKGLHDRNILFSVDGIQTVGAFPMSMEHVDLLAADAHKWLLGPCGAGIMYVRRPVQDRLNPPVYGWHNVKCPDFVTQEQIVMSPGASKYEAGTTNLLGLVGLMTAIELLLEVGIENIAAELTRKRAWLLAALQASGCSVLHGDAPPENGSGIISFFRPGADMAALHQKLTAASVTTNLRVDRAGQRYIRISPHFYNTDAELRQFLELV